MSVSPDAAADDLAEVLIIDLATPIDTPGGPITQLMIAEPTAGQILQWDKLAGAEADIVAVSVVAGIPKNAVEKLPARVFYRAARRIGAFLS